MKMDILILRVTGLKRGQGRRASAVQPYKEGRQMGTQTRIAQHVIFALFWRNN